MLAFVLALIIGFGFLAPPAIAQDADSAGTEDDGRVKLTIDLDDDDDDEGIEIRLGGNSTRNSDYVRFGDSIHVREDEHIRGDVVSIGGSITVDGKVSGDCVSVGGSITLGPGAEVTGEVVCVGGTLTLDDSSRVGRDAASVWGRLDMAPSAVVVGDLTEVQGGFGPIQIPSAMFGVHGFSYSLWELFVLIVLSFVLVGIGIVAFQIFPSRMSRLAETVDRRGLVSFLAGMAGWVLWLPVFILLLITVVGIPVAFLFLFITPLMMLLGYLAVARTSGTKVGKTGTGSGILAGVFLLAGILITSHVFGLFGSFFEFIAGILGIIGCCVIFVAVTMGFGAILITRFRPEERGMGGTAPPPANQPPPYQPPPPPQPTPTG